MKNITTKRSRARIVDKLISMGLVSDRKELYKKQRKLTKGANQEEEEDFLNDVGYDVVQGLSDVDNELDEDDSSNDETGESMIKFRSRYAAKGAGQKMGLGEIDPAISNLCYKLRQQ
eukprot:g26991.t1